MTEGIVQKTIKWMENKHLKFAGSQAEVEILEDAFEDLKQELIEEIKQTLDYKADNENTVTYYILKLLIGDTQE